MNIDCQVESGARYANGVKVNQNFLAANSGYVQQDDLFIGTLTVREHLNFQVSFWLLNSRPKVLSGIRQFNTMAFSI